MKFKLALAGSIDLFIGDEDEDELEKRRLIKILANISDLKKVEGDSYKDVYNFKSSNFFSKGDNYIEFNTLEEIMNFKKEIGWPVIIYTEKGEEVLEIYNDRRE